MTYEQKQTIMIVEDDEDLAEGIRLSLNSSAFSFYLCSTVAGAKELFLKHRFDLLILDINLPDGSGLSLCRDIRRASRIPIVLLTAKDMEMDIVAGLESGADDYITKPFNILEVKARIKAIMRRTGKKKVVEERVHMIEDGDLRLDCESRRLFIQDREVNLTGKEFELLELLVRNPNKVYGREKLLNIVWGPDYPGDVRTVDVHVRRMREKIEKNPSEPKYVHTKWGVGYYYHG